MLLYNRALTILEIACIKAFSYVDILLQVKKNVRKHKSLDEDTENELLEISKSSLLKSRIKECEAKDSDSAKAWTKEVKQDRKPDDPEAETRADEDLKEFSKSGRLKDLISSCAERDENKEESWKNAKQKMKSAEETDDLQELASLTAAKSKIIQQVCLLRTRIAKCPLGSVKNILSE